MKSERLMKSVRTSSYEERLAVEETRHANLASELGFVVHIVDNVVRSYQKPFLISAVVGCVAMGVQWYRWFGIQAKISLTWRSWISSTPKSITIAHKPF